MPRQLAQTIENTFIGGLNTEANALKFPPNACTETFNCVFDETGLVSRRPGVDLELNYVLETVTKETNEAFTEFLWSSVAGDGNRSFLVQQQGSIIHFYDISQDLDVSANLLDFTIDLQDYATGGGDPASIPCQYAIGNGDLIVVNAGANPVYVVYDVAGATISTNEITVRIRDFAGVTDGTDINERLGLTLAQLATTNPEHYYNLINQGWGDDTSGGSDVLAQWDTARADLPSNADIPSLYRSSATDAFDNSAVTANGPGNAPAPKGHFILDAFDYDRDAALLAEGYTVDPLGSGVTLEDIPAGDGTRITDSFSSDVANAFDGDTTQNQTTVARTGGGIPANVAVYLGKTFSQPYRIANASVCGSTDDGYALGGIGCTVTLTLYGKQGAAPSSSTNGTALGSVSFTDTTDESTPRIISSNDQTTQYDHAWIRIIQTGGGTRTWALLR